MTIVTGVRIRGQLLDAMVRGNLMVTMITAVRLLPRLLETIAKNVDATPRLVRHVLNLALDALFLVGSYRCTGRSIAWFYKMYSPVLLPYLRQIIFNKKKYFDLLPFFALER